MYFFADFAEGHILYPKSYWQALTPPQKQENAHLNSKQGPQTILGPSPRTPKQKHLFTDPISEEA